MINRVKIAFDFNREVSIAPLVIFRIIFGALALFASLRFILKGWVYDLYIAPKYFFGYYGFEWIKPLAGDWMYVPFFLMIIGSIGILFGFFYRFSAFLYFISFTYVELLDKSNYLNHYYFVSLMAFLMILVPANRQFSLDCKRKPSIQLDKVPIWTIRIIQFQLACVYFFAGVAKLNSDWLLNAQPLKIWLQAHRDMPIFGKLLASSSLAYFFSWAGCIYDLFIVFFLSWNKTRPIAYVAVIFFHFVTWYLFPIGIFPWVMIFSTLIFFSESFHERILLFGKNLFKLTDNSDRTPIKQSLYIRYFLILFIVAQMTIPMRYLVYPGNMYWNEEGFRFSWRVMLMHKEGHATFFVKDRDTGQTIEINNSDYLTDTQIDQMATQPDMILQYAMILRNTFADTILSFHNHSVHLRNPAISARIYVSLNGRPSQLFVNESHDLASLPYNLYHRNWIEKFQE